MTLHRRYYQPPALFRIQGFSVTIFTDAFPPSALDQMKRVDVDEQEVTA